MAGPGLISQLKRFYPYQQGKEREAENILKWNVWKIGTTNSQMQDPDIVGLSSTNHQLFQKLMETKLISIYTAQL